MYYDWKPYVSVAQRRAKAVKFAKQQAKKLGRDLQPIVIPGNKIAKTFWGKAWCDHLEKYSDYANRLPRGRTYVRNGSVIDLLISEGKITAFVSGSEIYEIEIKIDKLKPNAWKTICADCSSSIDSLFDLLQGKLSNGVMKRLTHPSEGLFPQPREIHKSCDCPDGAALCKHLAAVLYGIGSRLDLEPQLLFTLRGVDHLELIAAAASNTNLEQSLQGDEANALATDDLGAMFGIELEGSPTGKKSASTKAKAAPRKTAKPKVPTGVKKAIAKAAAEKASPKKQKSKVAVASVKNEKPAKKVKPTPAKRRAK